MDRADCRDLLGHAEWADALVWTSVTGGGLEDVPGVVARFIEAGHILGSAAISLEIEEKGRKIRFWFSGSGFPEISGVTSCHCCEILCCPKMSIFS